jgi:hypothetical protein
MWEIILSVCLGIGLSASTGFRVFIPLLLLSIAGYVGWIPLTTDWQWAGSMTAIIVLGVAAVVEIFAYFIPYLDNLLDTISIPLAAVAGTLAMVAVVGDIDPLYSWTLAIIAGGGTAAGIATTTSAARATSTTVTAGFANPVVNMVEVVVSTGLSILAMIAPFIGVILVILIFMWIRKVYSRMRGKSTLSRKRNHNKPQDNQ